MMQGTIYSRKTGEIYVSLCGSDEDAIKAQLPLYDDADYLAGDMVDQETFYMRDGVKTVRPIMPLERRQVRIAGDQTTILTGIPKGTRVAGSRFDEIVDDGTVEWTIKTPGRYQLELTNFPFQTRIIEIEVADT